MIKTTDSVDKTTIRIYKMSETPTDFAYWQSRPYSERLAALESIRNDYIKWAYDSKPGFQRVYRIIKQA